MKRISSVVVSATAALALLLAGCGSDEEAGEASDLRKGVTATTETGDTSNTTRPSESTESESEPKPPANTEEPRTPATEKDEDTPSAASDTTCARFKALDEDAQKALVERILADHPESSFAGSPNVALGTAKLVCNAGSLADTPVALAAGLIPEN